MSITDILWLAGFILAVLFVPIEKLPLRVRQGIFLIEIAYCALRLIGVPLPGAYISPTWLLISIVSLSMWLAVITLEDREDRYHKRLRIEEQIESGELN